ncbi:LPXTG-domain-containing protein [Colletotrichum musicola]|uniref:LPXTG-domain-containing protein n=1 Tax=Colletotrichum musicola TaxID=2175873 RepID=A0A8H6NZ25_9PEZI|nr:LPXTG-domain-containing protein [Colletotrichum musicola]
MAARSALFLLTTALPAAVSALQVTPDSPCASFCLDSNDLDYSDPKSSNTGNKDITCVDSRYQTEPAGRKFQQCLSCLQDSAFVQGSENDQSWFLYNARYAFDYCIFGYPNATGVGSNPCMTSTACGGLEAALIDGELDPEKSGQYSYCDADGGAMLGPAYDKCLSCVRAGGEHYYLANYLVALGAGCQQRPDPGKVLGLNQTVFTKGIITAVDPTDAAKAGETDGPALPMTAIVGIVVGAVVVLLLAAGCIFVQCRKRRARRAGRGVNPELSRRAKKGHRPDSSLSFRCQTHLTPKTPTFFPIQEEADDARDEKRRHESPAPPVSSRWMSPEALYSYRNSPAPSDRKAPLANITTSLPMVPVKSHSPRFNSPQEDYTPTSTTSAAPLLPLRHYVPAEHGTSSPSLGHVATFSSPVTTYSSPTSGKTASPLLSQAGWPAPAARPPAQIDNLPATEPGRMWNRPLPRRVTSLGGGSPVESHKIQVSFPPPPPPKKR